MILAHIRTEDVNAQYKLHAYVCGPDCVQWSDSIGTKTFGRIFTESPEECRYAVAGTWDIDEYREKVVVWDLDNVRGHHSKPIILTPDPVRVCDDVDAAIVSTAMLYDREE
jgi:hypothetical protein